MIALLAPSFACAKRQMRPWSWHIAAGIHKSRHAKACVCIELMHVCIMAQILAFVSDERPMGHHL